MQIIQGSEIKNFLLEISNKNNLFNNDKISTVRNIINNVKENKNAEIIKICNKFDGANFQKDEDLLVSEAEITQAKNNIDPKLLEALKISYDRITAYHQKQLPQDFAYIDKLGVKLGNIWKPLDSVGVYVPGGTANYPSSVLMGAIAAIVAGVKNISITVPSNNGKVAQAVLVAADLCNIKKIYKVGGAAAIAALAFGTENITKVDKIIGPGNEFVAIAKKELFGIIGIDMIAGPTDITIIADKNANPQWVACDLLSQLEHGVDSSAFLITDNLEFAKKVDDNIKQYSQKLSRKNIISKSLQQNCKAIIVNNLANDGTAISNHIAPEHLEIMSEQEKEIFHKIKNAGAIFLGHYSPEAIGDYIAGPSHTLPTSGNAKFSSGLSVFDFLKRISVISCSQASFNSLKEPACLIAENEGLDAHKLSMEIRK